MATIPENVDTLKRPELQKLCKAHKIRANMKNTEMVQALQEHRQQLLVESELREKVVAEEEGETVMKERVQAEEKKAALEDMMTLENKAVMKEENKKMMEDETVMEERDSTTVEEEEKKAAMEDEAEEEKDKTAMMKDEAVMEVEEKDMAVMEDDKAANKLVMKDVQAIEDKTRRDQDSDVVMDTEAKEERTKQANEVTEEEKPSEEEDEAKMEAITIEEEAEAVRQHELVVEDSNGNTTLALVAADGDDILNTTYTIEPPELLVDDPDDALSSSLLHPSSESPSTPLQGSWALDHGPTVRDSPLLRTQQAEKENTDKSIHEDMMALLNARVEERKQEPGYCPKEMVDAGPSSKIPVRSDIAQRFDDVHKKQFNQMTSIKDDLEHRKRRRTPSHNPTSRLHEPLTKKAKPGPQPTSKPDPRKGNTDRMSFAKRHRPAAAAPSKHTTTTHKHTTTTYKTPSKKPLTQSQKTPHLESSKRPIGYTPHKGPLPKYRDTASKI